MFPRKHSRSFTRGPTPTPTPPTPTIQRTSTPSKTLDTKRFFRNGVIIAAEFHWVEHPDSDLVALLDEAFAQLEAGLPHRSSSATVTSMQHDGIGQRRRCSDVCR
jgi:hypothetical protein